MKRLIAAVAMVLAWTTMAGAAAPAPLTTLRAVEALTNAQASRHLPVSFEATVTYFRSYESTLFAQDRGKGLYIRAATPLKLVPGDRILVRGTTYADFRPDVISSDITLLGHGQLPRPVPARFQDLIQAKLDSLYVVIRGVVRSADVQLSSGRHVTQLEVVMEGGDVGVTLDNSDPAPPQAWLDAEAEITGVASGRFDGKMQQTGVLLHAPSFRNVKILHKAARDPWSIPFTPMDQVLRNYNVDERTGRVRVQGTITYYHQAQMAVLQDGSRSIQVLTPQIDPLRVGDHGEAIGIPFVDNGFLTLKLGAIRSTGAAVPIRPVHVRWDELALSKHAFDLVSIDGTVITQVREEAQDVYIVSAQGHLFFATVRHPFVYEWGVVKPPPPMPEIAPGSHVRVTGVVMLDGGDPFNGAVGFGILMRSADDVSVIAGPPWLSVRHLTLLMGLLLAVVIAGGVRSWTVERKVRQETAALAYLEQRRSRILEEINASCPLSEIIKQITEVVSFKLHGAASWCEITGGACIGNKPSKFTSQKVVQQEIPGRSGNALGTIYAAVVSLAKPGPSEQAALALGAELARLAIESSQLYSDLVHRSEFDLLTDVQNRFAMEKTLETLIQAARQSAGIFGLIYLDLNEFKQVNDQYGHQVGDLYLQEAALRMKRQLRPGDMLARLGGDEFAVLVSEVRNRAEVEEIALRLERCFDEPFAVEGHLVHGSSSVGIALYPEDAATRDGLLSKADAAMYAVKQSRQDGSEGQAGSLASELASQRYA